MSLGFAKFQVGAEAEAVCWFRRSIETNRQVPRAHFLLAGALALSGSMHEARAAANAGLAIDPSFTLRRYRDGAISDNPVYLLTRQRLGEGIRLAGIQEG
jgi:hypothetical protein